MDFGKVLRRLVESDVRFILIGGVAAIVHGAARLTQDIDFLYSREPHNLERLVAALAPLEPYPRGAPQGLPFVWDAQNSGGRMRPPCAPCLHRCGYRGRSPAAASWPPG